jgi:hypothetical protein
MSDVDRYHGQLAAFYRHRAAPEKIAAAARDLSGAKVVQAVNAERARLDLPPLGDDHAAVLTGVAFLEAA